MSDSLITRITGQHTITHIAFRPKHLLVSEKLVRHCQALEWMLANPLTQPAFEWKPGLFIHYFIVMKAKQWLPVWLNQCGLLANLPQVDLANCQ